MTKHNAKAAGYLNLSTGEIKMNAKKNPTTATAKKPTTTKGNRAETAAMLKRAGINPEAMPTAKRTATVKRKVKRTIGKATADSLATVKFAKGDRVKLAGSMGLATVVSVGSDMVRVTWDANPGSVFPYPTKEIILVTK